VTRPITGIAPDAALLAPSSERVDDLRLLAKAAAGADPHAAATLVAQVASTILATVRQVLGRGHADVDDVAQEATLAFLAALPEFRGECSTRRYAQRVALFAALTARRRLVARQRLFDLETAENMGVECDRPSPWAETLSSHRRETLRGVLDSLPDVIAQALALHFILGYTVEEIATVASAPQNTIWSRLRLGKKALRKTLRNDPTLAELFGGLE
jgi:RNA polymerase sigma-70 factor (ECF subfamily)